MNWSQESEKLIESWADTQRQLWSMWLGQGGDPNHGEGVASAGPLDNLAWLRKAADLWGREGVVGRTLGNLLSSQEMVGRSIELLAQAWQQVLPRLEAGEDWQSGLRAYLDRWIEQVAAVPEQSVGASKEAAQLLNSILWDWSPVLGPWLNSAYKASLSGDLGASLLKGSEGLDRLLAMEQEFEPAIAGLGEVPRAGLLRERNAKLLLTMDAMTALRNAAARYQMIVARGLAKAVENTIRHIIEQAEAGTPVTGVRGLVRTWFRIADQTLMHTFSTAEFIAAQNELAAASMDYKVRQRDLLALVYEVLEIPTRGELDDLYQSLHQLKREVRELRRAQRPGRTDSGRSDPGRSDPGRRGLARTASEVGAAVAFEPEAPGVQAAPPKPARSRRKRAAKVRKHPS